MNILKTIDNISKELLVLKNNIRCLFDDIEKEKQKSKYHWTYCKDSLPPLDYHGDSDTYLLIDDIGYYAVGLYRHDAEMWDTPFGWYDGNEIIAWMPLPDAPDKYCAT